MKNILIIGKKSKKAFENLKIVNHKKINKTLEDYIKILSDCYYHSLLEPKVIEGEKKIVLNELYDLESDIQSLLFIENQKISFQNIPLGLDAAGSYKTVHNVTRDILCNFLNI